MANHPSYKKVYVFEDRLQSPVFVVLPILHEGLPPFFSILLPVLLEGLPPPVAKISTNFTIGTRVSYLNARTQQPETGTVTSTDDRLSDGTVIVTIRRDAGGTVQLPVAALQPA